MSEKGNISIHTENILPIIKKWLYAEKEIFIRELVSNASDAITKLHKLSMIEEIPAERIPEPRIELTINKDASTIVIKDTGIGMTAEEIKKYINQVAFSGVQDFVKKFEGKDDQQQIIGHFGLGFYSAFMVASKVEIRSLSYQKDSVGAHWTCDGSTEFILEETPLETVGTEITLHIAEDSKELLDESTVKNLLIKYCGFLSNPIFLKGEQVNDTQPLWTKNPSSINDDEYKEFYKKNFFSFEDPLFWIQLNLDYPFKLRGILFFPKIKHELEASQGQVKLFCNQVFVADNSKELIPEFLTLLKGMIDCPDLPLNVSRSYLQNDPQVKLISQHITKKIADKLSGMNKTDRALYESYWDDISPFVKFGMMRDDKFAERMKEHVIFKLTCGGYKTPEEYIQTYGEQTKNKIIYASQVSTQGSYIHMLKEVGLDCIVTDTLIDQHFVPYMEMQNSRKYEYVRCDSDVLTHLSDPSSASTIVDPKDESKISDKIAKLFQDKLKQDGLIIKVEALKSSKVPAFLMVDESKRRMQEFAKMNAFSKFGMDLGSEKTLVINENNPAIKKVLELSESVAKEEETSLLIQQIYDLAQLQHAPLSAEGMQSFIERSSSLLSRI